MAKIKLYHALLSTPSEAMTPNEVELCFYLATDKQVQDYLGRVL